MASVKLSILIPSIPERIDQLRLTLNSYNQYIEKYNLTDSIELLSIIDNKKRSIGKKRSDLIAISQGEYVAMSDDDDFFTEKYFELIGPAMELGSDVITYWQYARINQEHSFIEFGLNLPIQDFVHKGITKRPAWHCCTWRKNVVYCIEFADINWGEDHAFAVSANAQAKTETHIPEVCHVYQHDSHKTAAFQ